MAVGDYDVKPFPGPTAVGPDLPRQIRGNDNVLRQKFVDHQADTAAHNQFGTFAARPVTATLGTVYYAEDTQAVYLYGSAGWIFIAGAGGAGVTGSGTTGNIPKWSAASALTDSIMSEATGTITIAGALAVQGNTTIGDATSDTLTITARLASDIVPSTAGTRNLGSSTLNYANVYTSKVYAPTGGGLELYSDFSATGPAINIVYSSRGVDFRRGTPSSNSLEAQFSPTGGFMLYVTLRNGNGAADIGESGARWRDGWFSGTVTAAGFSGPLTGNASTASAWQTARTLTIGSTGKSVNGSANVAWSLAEIGAPPTTEFAEIVWGTPSAESADSIEVLATCYDMHGNVFSTGEVSCDVIVSNSAASCEPSSTATIAAATVPVGSIIAGTGTATGVFKTNSSGQFRIRVTETAAADRFLWVRSGGHQQLFVKARDGIQQLTFA